MKRRYFIVIKCNFQLFPVEIMFVACSMSVGFTINVVKKGDTQSSCTSSEKHYITKDLIQRFR